MEGIQNNFVCGAVYGLIAAGIIGFILVQIRAARIRMKWRDQTLDTFPDAVQAHVTPSRIVRTSRMGTLGCIFWSIVLIVVVMFVLRTAFQIIVSFGN